MKVLTITQFRRLCEQISPATFSFDSDNQSSVSNMKMINRYTDIIFMLNPNRICLKNECGTLCFNNVKSVKYFNADEPLAWMVFDIVCADSLGGSSPASYTILADSVKCLSLFA